jgi:hypothetical protein
VIGVLTSTFAARTLRVGDREIDLDEQGRVAVQAWGEVAHNEELRDETRRRLEGFTSAIAGALARGQRAGRVPAGLDATDGAWLVFALLPGMILQRAMLGHDGTAVGRAAAALLDG